MERCKENDCFVRLQKGKLISGGDNLYLSAKVTPGSEKERTYITKHFAKWRIFSNDQPFSAKATPGSEEEITYKLTTSHFAKPENSCQNDQPL